MKKIFLISVSLIFVSLVFQGQAVSAQEDVARLLQELENNSDRFAKSLDNAMDNSRINGTPTEGEITRYVHEFEDSIDRLKKQYDQGKTARIAAQDTMDRARAINRFLRKYPLDSATQTDWTSVKSDMERIAKVYKVKIRW